MDSGAAASQKPSLRVTTIGGRKGLFSFGLSEVWEYRDLVLLFVRRDFIAQYKQTILGPLWFIIQPVLMTLVFVFVFGQVAKLSTDGLPQIVFYLSGVVLWRYFSECLVKSSETFIGNAAIFGKVYFPRLVVAVSKVLSSAIGFALQFCIFLVFLLYFALQGQIPVPGPAVLLTPVLVCLMAAMGMGLGIIVSSLTIKYRDLRFLIGFGMQLFMYATPIIYPVSMVPEKYRSLVLLNPMAPVVEAFRHVWLGGGSLSWPWLGYSTAFAVVVLVAGLLLFSRVERTFMDTV